MGTGRSAATSAEEVRNAPEQMMSHVNHIDFRREIDWTVMVCVTFTTCSNNFKLAGRTPSAFPSLVFFGWNGGVIELEYYGGHWVIFQWMSQTLPQIVSTMLVLCAALPLAHLFTGDWIRHGYFDAVYLAEPILVCRPLDAAA